MHGPLLFGTLVLKDTVRSPSFTLSSCGTVGHEPEPCVVTMSRSPSAQARTDSFPTPSTTSAMPLAVGSPAYPGAPGAAGPEHAANNPLLTASIRANARARVHALHEFPETRAPPSLILDV